MSEIPMFERKWPVPQTGAEAADLAIALMITKKQLASVIDVSPSSLSRPKLSDSTKKQLRPLLDVFNPAIWMARDEKRAAFWMSHQHPQGMGPDSPLDWIAKGKAQMVKSAQEAVLTGWYE